MYRWMMSVVVNHLSPSLPQPQGFLLGCLLLLMGLISVPITHPTSSGVDSFAAGILSKLGIPTHMADL